MHKFWIAFLHFYAKALNLHRVAFLPSFDVVDIDEVAVVVVVVVLVNNVVEEVVDVVEPEIGKDMC